MSGTFKGFKNWQKVAEICYQFVHDRAIRSLALFLIRRQRLIYMALTLCEDACKTEWTHAPHQLGHETKHIKFQVVLLLEKNSDVAKKS